jgi:hypothetical protein
MRAESGKGVGVTEQEWLECTDPAAMLAFLQGKAGERKLRLFMIACCRRVWEWMPQEGRFAVEVCEEYADGRVGQKRLSAARRSAYTASKSAPAPWAPGRYSHAASHAGVVALHACDSLRQHEAWQVAGWAAGTARSLLAHMTGDEAGAHEPKGQCSWLRDLFGPCPFRPVVVSDAVRAWNDGCVVKLAESISAERDVGSERLGVLADALEECGADMELVGHLRGPGPHLRGCWAVDLCRFSV